MKGTTATANDGAELLGGGGAVGVDGVEGLVGVALPELGGGVAELGGGVVVEEGGGAEPVGGATVEPAVTLIASFWPKEQC